MSGACRNHGVAYHEVCKLAAVLYLCSAGSSDFMRNTVTAAEIPRSECIF